MCTLEALRKFKDLSDPYINFRLFILKFLYQTADLTNNKKQWHIWMSCEAKTQTVSFLVTDDTHTLALLSSWWHVGAWAIQVAGLGIGKEVRLIWGLSLLLEERELSPWLLVSTGSKAEAPYAASVWLIDFWAHKTLERCQCWIPGPEFELNLPFTDWITLGCMLKFSKSLLLSSANRN